MWSEDIMSDALYHCIRFRTFNIIDDYNREVLAIDTSLRAERIIWSSNDRRPSESYRI